MATERELELLNDPEFRTLLRRRSRLRWGLTLLLVVAYLGYGIGGLYFGAFFARPIAGSGTTVALAGGFGIILLAIVAALYYVWRVNHIIAPLQKRLAEERR